MHASTYDHRTLAIAGLSAVHTVYGSVLAAVQADTAQHEVSD